jgi:hypothetical protein
MAATYGNNADFQFNAVNLKGSLKTVDLSYDVDTVDATCMGDTIKQVVSGVYGASMDTSFLWDPAASENDVTIQARIGNSTAAALFVVPGGGTISATNPKYTGNALVKSFKIHVPHDGMITCDASFVYTNGATRNSS